MNKDVFFKSTITFLVVCALFLMFNAMAANLKARLEHKRFDDGVYYRIKNLTNYVLYCEVDQRIIRLEARRATVWIKKSRQPLIWNCY